MRLAFFMPMIPPTVTHQTKKIRVVRGKPQYYEPAALSSARAKLTAHLAAHAPAAPYTGAVRLVVKWCFPVRKGHYNGEYKATRPDTDNLQKLLKDVMAGLRYFSDDALVASEIVEKFYADVPGIFVMLEAV